MLPSLALRSRDGVRRIPMLRSAFRTDNFASKGGGDKHECKDESLDVG